MVKFLSNGVEKQPILTLNLYITYFEFYDCKNIVDFSSFEIIKSVN
jgi:hypothetical protein